MLSSSSSSRTHAPTRARLLIGVTATVVASVAAVGPLATVASATTPTTHVLTNFIPGLNKLASLGKVADSQILTVGVVIPGNTAAQAAAYKAIQDPTSPDYQHFMTADQIRADFGVAAGVSLAVQKSVEADGLAPVYVAKDGTYVELRGTAAQVQKTFKVTIKKYHVTINGKAGTYFANTGGATVPNAVSTVLGLSNFSQSVTHASQNTCAPLLCTGVVGPSALWSTYDQPDTYTEGAALKATEDYGQGQKVAIFGEGDLTQVVKDLRLFEDATSVDGDATDLKPVLPHVPVRETLVGDDQTDTGGLGEWDLDSQSSTGMSPDLAELQFYFGEDLSDAAIAGIYSAWVNDSDGAMIGNSSFGGCEPLEGLLGDESTDDSYFQQAVMMGRTMFTSTGDTGSGGCVVGVDLNGLGNGGAPAVEYPSASPYVVAVGGTVLYTAASAAGAQTQPPTRGMEYAWTYTGGGSADFEPQFADQSLAKLGASPAVQPCVMPTGSICRAVPDVAAMSGDVVTNGYGIVSGGAQTETGGTSLSSPLWAGMWARVRAAHASTCTSYVGAPTLPTTPSQLGFAQHLLYAVAESSTANDAAAFFDIGGTSGTTTPVGNGAYTALPRAPVADPTGFDLVSGLGTPDLSGIIKLLDCNSTLPTTTAVPNSEAVTLAPVSLSSCGVNGAYTDTVGDEQGLTKDTALDITNATFTTTATGLNLAMGISSLPESSPLNDNLYDWDFSYGGGNYEVEYDNGNAGDTKGFTLYQLTTTSNGTSSTSLGTLVGSENDGTPGSLSVTLPFSVFNAAAKPTVALQDGSVLTGISMDTETLTYEVVDYSDTLSSNGCDYVVAGGSQVTTPAPPSLPDSSVPVALAAVGLLGGVVALRRRRRANG